MKQGKALIALSLVAVLLAATPAISLMATYNLLNSDNVTAGTTGSSVTPYKSYESMTCNALINGDNVTALTVSIQGNLGYALDNGTYKWDNLTTCAFSSAQLTNRICSFSISGKPTVNVRAKVEAHSGSGANNIKVYCGGVD